MTPVPGVNQDIYIGDVQASTGNFIFRSKVSSASITYSFLGCSWVLKQGQNIYFFSMKDHASTAIIIILNSLFKV